MYGQEKIFEEKMEVNENTYKSQLIYAQKYIEKLERHLYEQKVEMKRLNNSMRKKRRPGMQSSFRYDEATYRSDGSIYEENTELSSNFLVLKIENVNSNADDNSASFYFNPLCDQVYLVGQEGVTIGSGQGCGICLPSETGILAYHAAIKYNHENGSFYLLSYPQNKTTYIEELINKENELDKENIKSGFTFTTGILQWKVYGLSPIFSMKSSLYFTAQRNDLHSFNLALDMYSLLIGGKKTANNQNILDELKYHKVVRDNFQKKSKQKNLISLLQVAVKQRSFDIVKKLLDYGVNIDLQNGEEKVTALHVAIMNDDYEMSQYLLQNGADLDICDSYGRSPLSMSISHKIRKLLLNCMMLCSACYAGDINQARRLLEDDNLPVDCKGFRGHTPLSLACKYGDLSLVELLLARNANTNIRCGYLQRSCLHNSVLRDDMEMSELLLSHGANKKIVDRCDYTPEEFIKSIKILQLFHNKEEMSLCNSVQCNDLTATERLLDVTKKDVNYTIPPEEVCRRISTHELGRKDSVHLLQQNAGITPLISQKNGRGLAPIHLAAASGNVELIYLLASYGANIELAGGIERWTPLFFAVLCHRKEAVKTLLQLGADKEYCFAYGRNCKDHLDHVIKIANQMKESLNFDGSSAKEFEYILAMIPPQFLEKCSYYDITCENDLDNLIKSSYDILQILSSSQQKMLNVLKEGDTQELMKLLDQQEVNVNEILSKSLPITPLDYAASTGMSDIVDVLLLNHADPLIDDSKGYAPLHSAIEAGHAAIVETFLKFNVNVNLPTRGEKYTPLHVAALHSRKKIIEILLDNGADRSRTDINNCRPFDLTNDEILQRMLACPEDHFYLAITQNDLSLAEILIETSPNVNQHFRNGLTPLHIAVKLGLVEMATFLINNGADVNAQDCCDVNIGTPLHYACMGDSAELTKLLLDNSASLSIGNSSGKTPYEVSSSNKIRWILHSKFQRPNPDRRDSKNKMQTDANEDKLCAICRDNEINVVVLPCLHLAFCLECVTEISECSLCRARISSIHVISDH